ncbi:MAG: hypothetical protein NTX66_01550 [Candidatus Falkowbacteria bacterium]|nr:hypothetical protein [Candidatus Falkowbacteria bacterium]
MRNVNQEINFENFPPRLSFAELKKETKILDAEGDPLVMYNRSHNDFEKFELGKRNLEAKDGINQFGFFFSDRNDLEHYGPFVKARYLNIKKPWDIRDLGARSDYKSFRAKLKTIGITDKDLAGYDHDFQDHNIKRNKALGSYDGLYKPGDTMLKPAAETRMATFNFFDAGEGYYLRKLLQGKGFDGVIFADEGENTAIAFNPSQIIEPNQVDLN